MDSLRIAFSMYSRVPVGTADWSEENLRYSLCFFPLVGAVEGSLCLGLLFLFRSGLLAAGLCGSVPALLLAAALMTAFPVLYTGGIHHDGFLDVSDALGSNGTREKKLEILKDPACGAFAVINCVLLFLISFAAWTAVADKAAGAETFPAGKLVPFALSFPLSRSVTGLMLMHLPNARGSGSAMAFSSAAEQAKGKVKLVLSLWLYGSAAAGFAAAALNGGIAAALLWLFPQAAAVLFSVRTSMREFGGVTGDLCGFTLVLTEAAALLGTAAGLLIA